MRTRVKICGITSRDDALAAVALGADALGFIFYPKSPRFITPAAARDIIGALSVFVTTVAVIVNETPQALEYILTSSGCAVVQLAGEESAEYLASLPYPAIKSLAIACGEDLAAIPRYSAARAILLDTRVAGQFGGTGKPCDWQLAIAAKAYGRPLILAGGLSPENIAEAIHTVQPHAVDINSCIEREPGKKDHARMRQLFAEIRRADAE